MRSYFEGVSAEALLAWLRELAGSVAHEADLAQQLGVAGVRCVASRRRSCSGLRRIGSRPMPAAPVPRAATLGLCPADRCIGYGQNPGQSGPQANQVMPGHLAGDDYQPVQPEAQKRFPNPAPWGDALPKPKTCGSGTYEIGNLCVPRNAQQLRSGNLNNGADSLASTLVGWQGGNCELYADQVVCYDVSGIQEGGHPQTIGDVLLYPGSKADLMVQLADEKAERDVVAKTCDRSGSCLDPNVFGLDLLKHEAKHSDQWAKTKNPAEYGAGYGFEVAKSQMDCGDYGKCNWYEVDANPFKGGYWQPPVVGPDGYFQPAPGTPSLDYVQRLLSGGP